MVTRLFFHRTIAIEPLGTEQLVWREIAEESISSRIARSRPTSNHLTMSFLLFAQYGGRAVIPVAEVCRDFFAPLTLDNFLRKVGRGDIALPVIRMEASQKSAKGVHLTDLANYIDAQREAARVEMEALSGGAGVRLCRTASSDETMR